jgi:hypothetical protein
MARVVMVVVAMVLGVPVEVTVGKRDPPRLG